MAGRKHCSGSRGIGDCTEMPAHWRERDDGASFAGDEVYYLGLLFTLISLILAVIQLFVLGTGDNLRDRTYELIGNFGVALVSTVAGILGRILLQGRGTSGGERHRSPAIPPGPTQTVGPPPDDLPSGDFNAVRLREQLQALRRNLFEAADGFAHFTRVTLEQADGTRASTERVVAGFTERLTEIAQAQVVDTAESWRAAATAMRMEHENAVGDAKRELLSLRQRWMGASKQMHTELERLAQRFDTAAAEALQRTETGWSKLANSLASAAETMRNSQDAYGAELQALLADLEALRQGLQPFTVALARAHDGIATFQDAAQGSAVGIGSLDRALQETQKTMSILNETVTRVDAGLGLQVSDMAASHRTVIEGIKGLIADVDELCRSSLASRTSEAQTVAAAVTGISGQADAVKAKVAEFANVLDAQRIASEEERTVLQRNIEDAKRLVAEFQNLPNDAVRHTTIETDRRISAVEDAKPRADGVSRTTPAPGPERRRPRRD